jgi:hypothetical protein
MKFIVFLHHSFRFNVNLLNKQSNSYKCEKNYNLQLYLIILLYVSAYAAITGRSIKGYTQNIAYMFIELIKIAL